MSVKVEYADGPLFDNLGVMTLEQVASTLGFATQTIRNWVAQRSIPFVRVGGKTMFRRTSLQAWLEQKEFKPWQ